MADIGNHRRRCAWRSYRYAVGAEVGGPPGAVVGAIGGAISFSLWVNDHQEGQSNNRLNTFQKNVFKTNLEFGYLLEFSMKKKGDIFSFPKKNPLLKTGIIIGSRQSQLKNEIGNLKIDYAQNVLILPVGILNSIKISDKKTKIYLEHGVGCYLNFLLAESIDSGTSGLDKYVLSFFSRGTFGVYLEAGFSTMNEKKKRHSVGLKLSKEINQALYEGDTKFPFELRNFNVSISYSLFEFIK